MSFRTANRWDWVSLFCNTAFVLPEIPWRFNSRAARTTHDESVDHLYDNAMKPTFDCMAASGASRMLRFSGFRSSLTRPRPPGIFASRFSSRKSVVALRPENKILERRNNPVSLLATKRNAVHMVSALSQ